MNILIPLAGDNYTKENRLIPLIDIHKKTVIEYVLDNLNFNKNKFIFILNQRDCDRHHLDSILKLLKPDSCLHIVRKDTQGQLCSCMLGIEYINNDEPLLIVNGDQYVQEDVKKIIDYFHDTKADGGIATFSSIHPKWSYALLGKDGQSVLQTTEKVPVSNNACAGMFYYRQGKDFIEAAKQVIKKETMINGKYFVSSTFNELLLMNKKVIAYKIKNENFFPLDTEESIYNFATRLKK